MGRKKRKSVNDGDDGETNTDNDAAEAVGAIETNMAQAPASADPSSDDGTKLPALKEADLSTNTITTSTTKSTVPSSSSGYAMTSHSGEMLQEDMYVSDGSEDAEDDEIEVLLVGSRMGVMRRGLHHPSSLMVQPNREWVRGSNQANNNNNSTEGGDLVDDDHAAAAAAAEEQRRLQEEEELAKLDPAQRAARLLQEKQRKLEEAKELARRVESEENAGRDPSLFSKRTAFDIRFDQIDDKPWTRGTGDLSDFFNYGLSEDDWLEYAQQQLNIRQELTDSSRQKRAPDPSIVPVIPRLPKKQTPRVAVASVNSSNDDDQAGGGGAGGTEAPSQNVPGYHEVGEPEGYASTMEKGAAAAEAVFKAEENAKIDYLAIPVGVGGAWGAGAAPGSKLAQLIEEQERLLNHEQQPAHAGVTPVIAAAAAAGAAVPSTMDDRQSENQYAPSETTEDDAMSQGMNSTANQSQTAYFNDSSHYYGTRYSGGGGGRGRGGGWHDRSAAAAPPLPPPPSSVQAPPPYRGGRGGGGGSFGGGRYGGRGGRGGPGGGVPPPMAPYGQPYPGAYGHPHPGAYGQPPMPPYGQVPAAPPPPYGQPPTDDGTAGSGSDYYARKRRREGDPRDPRRRR